MKCHILLVSIVCVSSPIYAQGAYMGMGVEGARRHTIIEAPLPLYSLGDSFAFVELDGQDIEWSGWNANLFGGYQFNPYIGVEVRYSELAADDRHTHGTIYGEGQSISFLVMPSYPLLEGLDVFAEIGYEYSTERYETQFSYEPYTYTRFIETPDGGVDLLEYDIPGDDYEITQRHSNQSYPVGIGLKAHLTDDIFARLSVRSTINDWSDRKSYGLEFGYKF